MMLGRPIPTGKVGRPLSGRTSQAFAFRLENNLAEELKRRAAVAGISVAVFVEQKIRQELAPRPGQSTRKNGKPKHHPR